MAGTWEQVWRDLRDSVVGARASRRPPVEIEGARAITRTGNEVPAGEVESPEVVNRSGGRAAVAPDVDRHASGGPPPADGSDASVPASRRRETAVAAGVIVAVGAMAFLGAPLLDRLSSPPPPAPDVVATFDGGRITLADVESHLQLVAPDLVAKLVGAPEAALMTVEDLVTHALVERWAAKRRPESSEDFRHAMRHVDEELSLDSLLGKLHTESIPVSESEIRSYFEANQPEFGRRTLDEVRETIRARLVAEREPAFIDDYIARLRANASVTRSFELLDVPGPGDDELRSYYAANRDRFQVPPRDVVDEVEIRVPGVEGKRAAERVLRRLRAGARLEEAAGDLDGVSVRRGVTLREGARGESWDVAMRATGPGELAGPIADGGAFYVARLRERLPAGTRPLAEVLDEVTAGARRQATERRYERDAARTLFTIKGERYTLGRFYEEYRELPPSLRARYEGPDGARRLAEALIDRLLLARAAYEQALDLGSRDLSDEARVRLLRQMMEQEEVDDRIEISDEEVRAYFEQERERMVTPAEDRIRYIRVGLGFGEDEKRRARERIDEAYEKLAPGLLGEPAAFEEVAREYSEDPESAAAGGVYPGWIGETADPISEFMLHPLHEVAARLEPGEIGKPFRLGDSWYIVQVLERRPPAAVSFEEVAPAIRELLRDRRHDELARDLQQRLLEEAKLVVYRQVLERYLDELARRRRTADPAPAARGAS